MKRIKDKIITDKKIRKERLNKKCVKDKISIEDIIIIDDKGYDIEQFLCRCSNKTGGGGVSD